MSSHSYLSMSLMKGIVLFFELCFSLLQSANWIRNKVHIMKTGTGLEPALLKRLNSMRVENPTFLHVMSLSMIQLSAAVISQSQKRAAMHQQNPPKSHQRTGGQIYLQLWIPNVKSKRDPFCFSITKNNNNALKNALKQQTCEWKQF